MTASDRIEQLLRSGELARVAKECASQNELCRRIGMSKDAFISARIRLIARGVMVPSFDDLKLARGVVSETTAESDPHQAMGSGQPDKWPSVAAFDAEQGAVDVVPERHCIKGVSTLVGADGDVKAQWIKTTAQNDERAEWLEAIRSIGETLPRIEPTRAPDIGDEDLLAVYPVGDPHAGMLGWREDAGENFDLDIAERNLVGAFNHLISLAPAAKHALLIFIGDNVHADGQYNTTTRGTRVDVDGRTIKMMRVIVRICRRAIDLALAKHGHVTMIVERGNHDELLSAMLALALSLAYENEPRVTIDVSPEMFHWFRFGSVLIGTHHGDKAKPEQLLGVMATDRQQDWGETKHRRFYCGHYHHQIVKEVHGMIVEYLPTLASQDAWHRAMGYRAMRAMYMDVFHREHGHINRHIIGIDQLRAA